MSEGLRRPDRASRRAPTRRKFLLLAVAAAGAGALGRPAAADEGAGSHVEALLADALAVLRETREDSARRAEAFRRLLAQYFGLSTITRLVIGRRWRAASEGQKQAFSAVFEDHLVAVYTVQLGSYEGEEIVVRGTIPRSERDTIVSSEVLRAAGPPLKIDWLVRRAGSDYRVIDVAAEGISMMTTKRSEFSAIMAREGMDGLISRLRASNAGGILDAS